MVFGKACADNIYEQLKKDETYSAIEDCDMNAANNDLEKYQFYKHKTGNISVANIRLDMQKIMQKHAGVFRNDILLQEGVKNLKNLYEQFQDVYIEDKTDEFNSEFIELLELKNLLDNALVTMHSANYRKESRGAHSHEIYPEETILIGCVIQ